MWGSEPVPRQESLGQSPRSPRDLTRRADRPGTSDRLGFWNDCRSYLALRLAGYPSDILSAAPILVRPRSLVPSSLVLHFDHIRLDWSDPRLDKMNIGRIDWAVNKKNASKQIIFAQTKETPHKAGSSRFGPIGSVGLPCLAIVERIGQRGLFGPTFRTVIPHPRPYRGEGFELFDGH